MRHRTARLPSALVPLLLLGIGVSLRAQEPAPEAPTHPELDVALAKLAKDCNAPALKLQVQWAELEKGYVDDVNAPFNAGIVDRQGAAVLLALAGGCTGGLSVVDKVIAHKVDAKSTRFERPRRPIPVDKLRALQVLELTLNKNDAAFRGWQSAHFGEPPTEPYAQIFKGRYDDVVFKEDLAMLQKNPYTQLPPRMSVEGKKLVIGLGSTVEIREPWFERTLDLALQGAK